MIEIYRKRHKEETNEIDENIQSAADYSILITNFPDPKYGMTTLFEIRRWIESLRIPDKDVHGKVIKNQFKKLKVLKINIAWDLTALDRLKTKKQNILNEKKRRMADK